jgi:hypothetical protein
VTRDLQVQQVQQAQPDLKVLQETQDLQAQQAQQVHKDFQSQGLLDHRELQAKRVLLVPQEQPVQPGPKVQLVLQDPKVLQGTLDLQVQQVQQVQLVHKVFKESKD